MRALYRAVMVVGAAYLIGVTGLLLWGFAHMMAY